MTEMTQEDITLEASLLKALTIKDNYDAFSSCIDTKTLIPLSADLLKDYKKWYDKYNTNIDMADFYNHFAEWHKDNPDKYNLKYYREHIFPLIQNSNVSNNLFIHLLERNAARQLAQALSKGVSTEIINKIMSDLETRKRKYTGEVVDDEFFTLDEIDLSVLDTSNGIEWCLRSLQANLQSHMPGQFYLVSADSDTGKSAFCITQVAHAFEHLNAKGSTQPILYCTSEDTKADLTGRLLSCLYKDKCLGGFEEVWLKNDKIKEHFKKTYNKDLFKATLIKGPQDLIKIKKAIEKEHPSLIVIDILDKLSMSDNIQDLTRLYQEIRGIANEGDPILATSQSGNTSYQDKDTKEYKHRKWLTDKDVANSKSGKQGACYGMIMIGKDDDVPNIRYISTTKKKRGKHCNITCELQEKYSYYKELL